MVEEGGMIWKDSIEMYITICKIDSQWEFAVWHREPKASALQQPGGRGGGGFGSEGAHVCIWLIHGDVWQKPSHYHKYPPIKIN